MAHTIDTLKLFDDLKESFTEEQAHKLSVIFKLSIEGSLDELATKQNVVDSTASTQQAIAKVTSDVEREIEALRAETQQAIAEVKRDIEALRAETQYAIAEVKRDIEALRAEVKRDIEELRIEVRRDAQAMELRLKNEMQQIKYDLTMRMGAMLAASIGIITALMKLL